MTPEERKEYGRQGAVKSWAQTTDRTARTAKARAAFDARFKSEEERSAYYRAIVAKRWANAKRCPTCGRKI